MTMKLPLLVSVSLISQASAERYLQRYFSLDAAEFSNVSSYLTSLNTAAAGSTAPSNVVHREQSNISFHDDTPMEPSTLPFPFPYMRRSWGEVFVSPNGGLAFKADVPCGCCFMGIGCDLSNSYEKWIAAFTTDFNPAEMMETMANEQLRLLLEHGFFDSEDDDAGDGSSAGSTTTSETTAAAADRRALKGETLAPMTAEQILAQFVPSSGVFQWSSDNLFAVGWEQVPFYDSIKPLYSFGAALFPDARIQVVHSTVWFPEDLVQFDVGASWSGHWSVGLRGPWTGGYSGYSDDGGKDDSSTVFPNQEQWGVDGKVNGVYANQSRMGNNTVIEFCPVSDSLCAVLELRDAAGVEAVGDVATVAHFELSSVQMSCGKVFDDFKCAVVAPADLSEEATAFYRDVDGAAALASSLTAPAAYDPDSDTFSCEFNVTQVQQYVQGRQAATPAPGVNSTRDASGLGQFVVALLYAEQECGRDHPRITSVGGAVDAPFRQQGSSLAMGRCNQTWSTLPSAFARVGVGAFAAVGWDQTTTLTTTTTTTTTTTLLMTTVRSTTTTTTATTTPTTTTVMLTTTGTTTTVSTTTPTPFVSTAVETTVPLEQCDAEVAEEAYSVCGFDHPPYTRSDCFGECGGDGVTDIYGTCCHTREKDCYGICHGTASESRGFSTSSGIMCCSASLIDCANVCSGSASIDDCGVCAGGTTGLSKNADKDCLGVCFGNTTDDGCPTTTTTSPESGLGWQIGGGAILSQFKKYRRRACERQEYNDSDWTSEVDWYYHDLGQSAASQDADDCAVKCLANDDCTGFEVGSFEDANELTFHYCAFWFNHACTEYGQMYPRVDPDADTYVLFRDCETFDEDECETCPLWEWDGTSCVVETPAPSPTKTTTTAVPSGEEEGTSVTHAILMGVVIAVTSFSLILCCALTISLIRRRRMLLEQRRAQQALGMSDTDITSSDHIELTTFSADSKLEFGNECSICLVEFENNDKIRKLACRHHFHKECLDQWLHRQGTCPNCKLDVRPPQVREAEEHRRQQQELRRQRAAAGSPGARVAPMPRELELQAMGQNREGGPMTQDEAHDILSGNSGVTPREVDVIEAASILGINSEEALIRVAVAASMRSPRTSSASAGGQTSDDDDGAEEESGDEEETHSDDDGDGHSSSISRSSVSDSNRHRGSRSEKEDRQERAAPAEHSAAEAAASADAASPEAGASAAPAQPEEVTMQRNTPVMTQAVSDEV